MRAHLGALAGVLGAQALNVIKTADWVIDLGPEGGDAGGRIVAAGTPEQVARVKESYTGQYLANVLAAARKAS